MRRTQPVDYCQTATTPAICCLWPETDRVQRSLLHRSPSTLLPEVRNRGTCTLCMHVRTCTYNCPIDIWVSYIMKACTMYMYMYIHVQFIYMDDVHVCTKLVYTCTCTLYIHVYTCSVLYISGPSRPPRPRLSMNAVGKRTSDFSVEIYPTDDQFGPIE